MKNKILLSLLLACLCACEGSGVRKAEEKKEVKEFETPIKGVYPEKIANLDEDKQIAIMNEVKSAEEQALKAVRAAMPENYNLPEHLKGAPNTEKAKYLAEVNKPITQKRESEIKRVHAEIAKRYALNTQQFDSIKNKQLDMLRVGNRKWY